MKSRFVNKQSQYGQSRVGQSLCITPELVRSLESATWDELKDLGRCKTKALDLGKGFFYRTLTTTLPFARPVSR
jgi:hypothetical protein